MPRRSNPYGDPWIEAAAEVGQRIGALLKDVVPPDAQHHLLNAQRELLTALLLIYEHQAGARRSQVRRRVRPPAGTGRRRRLTRIDVE